MSSGGLIIVGYRALFFCNRKRPSDKTHKSTETELALPIQIRMCGTKTWFFSQRSPTTQTESEFFCRLQL